MNLHAAATETAERPRTVVWIDSRIAILARWDGRSTSLARVASDVPVHRRSTGHVTQKPGPLSSGGVAPRADGEARRLEHLARYLHAVAERVPEYDEVEVVGPGTVHERLAVLLRERDAAHRRERGIREAHAGPMTDPQLRARLRTLAGVVSRRGRRPRRFTMPRRGHPPVAPALEEERE